jgi:hypothetical protein
MNTKHTTEGGTQYVAHYPRNLILLIMSKGDEHRVVLTHNRFSLPAITGTYRTAYGARMALKAMRRKAAVLADHYGRDRRAWAEYGESLG